MKVSKGRSQPEIAAAAFLILYMVLGSPFLYQVLIATQMYSTFCGVIKPSIHDYKWSSCEYQMGLALEVCALLLCHRGESRRH